MSNHAGTLYVVATPIGNLEDITYRAVRVLAEVDLIAAEDTRHSRGLLRHYSIATPLTALHEHNERGKTVALLKQLAAGKCIALISDAGTPLVSDPGQHLVRAAHANGIRVVPLPGPCAAITALSAAGLPSERFVFEGFPPARAHARTAFFEALRQESRTLIFFEAPHRIVASLQAMAASLGGERRAVLARELTKMFEDVRHATLAELAAWAMRQPTRALAGEFVVLVAGAAVKRQASLSEAERILRILLAELPLKSAVALAVQITGERKRSVYQAALALRPRD